MTLRAQFLSEMERVVPSAERTAAIKRVYPKVSAEGGRPPMALERMPRNYFLQASFILSEPTVEEALYDSAALRSFVGVDLDLEPAPDETTACKFRRRLERHGIRNKLFAAVAPYLKQNGIKVSIGTIVGATIISAPSSIKNHSDKRDPEMHQTAKGKQWYFRMKARVRVESQTKMFRTVVSEMIGNSPWVKRN